LSQTVTIIAVVVNNALLELCNGTDGESPLAHIAVSVYIFSEMIHLSIFTNEVVSMTDY
jgi:hypothetical protein